jgi:hypothetical protein
MNNRFTRNPYLLFSPFFFFYCYLVVINKWKTLYGDEIRYVDFAHNLMRGFYSPTPHINLWNGPGYPILITPFIALKVPVLYISMLNALFLYLAIVWLFKSIQTVANYKIALILCLLLALYPNAQAILPILYTEAFTFMLVSGLIYTITLYYHGGHKYNYILAGLILGYIILTKIIFGYVIILCLLAGLASLLFKEHRATFRRPVKILIIAFLTASPYLVYTYHLTGKILYWGNSGGMSLYWMSSPFEHEYGDWKLPTLTNHQYPILFKSPEATALLQKNHKKEVNAILANKSEVQQDELFKQAAIRNIKQHPLKFIKNYYYNISRMLFNFPYSYSYQNGAIVRNILIGSLIFWASVIGLISTIVNWKQIIPAVRFLLFITGIYLLASGALSSYPRQFDVTVPVLLFWLGFLIANTQGLNLKFSGYGKK